MNDAFIHPLANSQSPHLGPGTRVWQYVVVLPQARIGADCNICSHCLIENDVVIGDRVTIKSGVQLWDGTRIEDDVFVGPNTTFTNDRFPRSKNRSAQLLTTQIQAGASIGANATVLPGLVIGRNSMVAAGSVVTRSVPSNAIVRGNPARIAGYVDTQPARRSADTVRSEPEPALSRALRTRGASLITLPKVVDLRGSLTFGELGIHLPFEPKRFFVVYDVPSREVRGEHAHKRLHEVLVCLKGSCSVMVDDGFQREEVLLDSPTQALHVAPGVWRVHYKYSADAMLLSLCSDLYDGDDYIRDYNDFLASARA